MSDTPEHGSYAIVAQRALLGAATLLVPGLGLLRAWTAPDAWDAPVARVVLGGLALGLLVGSYASAGLRRHLGSTCVGLIAVYFAWFAFVAARNGFQVDATLGLFLLTSIAIAIAPGLGQAAAFTGFALGTLAAAYGGVTDPTVPLAQIAVLIALQALAIGTAIHYRTLLERSLLDTRAQLEHRVAERTAQLEAEVAVREHAQQEALKASRAKNSFLATMSHELRTPLNAIIGYAELAREELGETATLDVLTDLRHVEDAATHLLGVVDDVLDIARIESGSVELRLDGVEASELVAMCVRAVSPDATAKGLSLFQDVPAGVLVRADPTRLRQILLNLLSNAVKFTETGGIHVDLQDRGGLVAIHVHDTGRGISPTALSSAFDRFVKLDDTPDRSAGGTGLGLAISRELARLMNGDLTARSELDRGSTFTILLPKYDRRRHSLAEAPRELH